MMTIQATMSYPEGQTGQVRELSPKLLPAARKSLAAEETNLHYS